MQGFIRSAALIAFGAAFLQAGISAQAGPQGSWVVVNQTYWDEPILGRYGLRIWVDTGSIVKQQGLVYYNISGDYITLHKTANEDSFKPVGWIADCNKKMLKGPNGPWRLIDVDNLFAAAGKFVCNLNYLAS